MTVHMAITRWLLDESGRPCNWEQETEKLPSLRQNKTGADCGTDHKPVISNVRVKLNKTIKRIVEPKYNVSSMSDEFKVHMKDKFVLLNHIDQEPEGMWTEMRNIRE